MHTASHFTAIFHIYLCQMGISQDLKSLQGDERELKAALMTSIQEN